MIKKHLFSGLVFSIIILSGNEVVSRKAQSDPPLIRIETEFGDMVIMLFNETPLHRDNMLKLIEEGFYQNLLFHRVINNFMIQGGDPDSRDAAKGERLGMGGPGYTIPAEFHGELFHRKGALSAARMGDQVNPEKASSGSQFYIVQGRVLSPEELNMLDQSRSEPMSGEAREIYTTLGGTPHLDGSYTVFGVVVDGLEVLDRIAKVGTDGNDRPLEDVVFSISLIRK